MNTRTKSYLTALPPEERHTIITKLQAIVYEIARYKYVHFWEGTRTLHKETHETVHIGDDIIKFDSVYYENLYGRCTYAKTLTYNGHRTTCLRLKNIIDLLKKLNSDA